jgi:hypothetical protein
VFDSILQGVNNITGLFDKRFITTIYLPCLVFFSILLAMVAYTQGLEPIIEQWNAQALDVRALILLLFLSIVYLFAYILSAFLMRILKYYEGYFGIFSPLVNFRKKYYQDRFLYICKYLDRLQGLKRQKIKEEKQLESLEEELEELKDKGDVTTEDRRQVLQRSIDGIKCSLEKIDKEIKTLNKKEIGYYNEIYNHYPKCEDSRSIDHILPTRLGNTIRSAELYPLFRYDIDSVLVWPRLYPLLPEPFTNLIADKKNLLDSCVIISFLGLVFAIFGGFYLFFIKPMWWLFPIVFFAGIFIWWIMYESAVQAAAGYGNVIRTAFDLYRGKLLNELGFEEIKNMDLDNERRLWHKVVQFFKFGTKQTFVTPPRPQADGDD